MPAGLAEPDILTVEVPEKVRTGGPGGGGPPDFEPGGGDHGGGGDDDEWKRRGSSPGPGLGMLGMLATMFSITALFVTIVIAFMVRSRTRSYWQPIHVPSFLWLSSALILLSSAALHLARRAFDRYRSSVYTRWLVITFFLSLAFILSQALSLRQLVEQGVYLSQNPHSMLYFLITAAHGVHLFGGMLALFYLIYRASRATANVRADLDSQRTFVSVATVYWHYLGTLWIALFLVLLLWR